MKKLFKCVTGKLHPKILKKTEENLVFWAWEVPY